MHSCLRESANAPVRGVRVWTAHLDSLSPKKVEELLALLNPSERARAGQFHFERDRRHYVTARGLLRELLGAALRESPSTLVFEYGVRGKPALAGEQASPLCFNLSHSAGWAMFVLAQNRQVGIDLESAARLDQDEGDLTRLAARVLSARELAIWKTLPDSAARRTAFLRAWTRKEAYAKATGRGVFETLAGLEVILDAVAPETSLTLASGWFLHDLEAPEGFAAAVAVEQKSEENVARGGEVVFAGLDNA